MSYLVIIGDFLSANWVWIVLVGLFFLIKCRRHSETKKRKEAEAKVDGVGVLVIDILGALKGKGESTKTDEYLKKLAEHFVSLLEEHKDELVSPDSEVKHPLDNLSNNAKEAARFKVKAGRFLKRFGIYVLVAVKEVFL